MKISKQDIIHVANLAHLNPDENAVEKYVEQIGMILEYVDKLKKVKTKDIPPTTHAISLTNAFRKDEEKEHLDIDSTLSNAPEKEDGCFVVPKIVG